MEEQQQQQQEQQQQQAQHVLSQLSHSVGDFASTLQSCNWSSGDTSEAVSLLQLKVNAFELYVGNLLVLCSAKAAGQPLTECQRSVERAAELRCVLDCVRPLETRLKHQIDKLVQLGSAGTAEPDAGAEAARLDDFDMSDAEEEEEEEGGGGGRNKRSADASGSDLDEEDIAASASAKAKARARAQSKATGRYVPPRITPMFFDEQRNGEGEGEADRSQRKRRQLQYDILQEMRQQLDDAPTEIADRSAARGLREAEERRQYEEANLTRVSVTKKQRQREQRAAQLASVETMNSLLPAGLLADSTGRDRPGAGSKFKAKGGGKAKGKFKGKKRKMKR